MVLGRAGMRLEAQKFGVYLLIPITASLAFNEPSVQRWSADYFQFMKYPSKPKTNLKDEYDALKKERDGEIEWMKRMEEKRVNGRAEHLNQLKQLQVANKVGDSLNVVDNNEQTAPRRGWFSWWRGRGKGGDVGENSQSAR